MNDQEAQEFIAVWQQEFGEVLTTKDANACMERLCAFFEQLAEAENAYRSNTTS